MTVDELHDELKSLRKEVETLRAQLTKAHIENASRIQSIEQRLNAPGALNHPPLKRR
ncbi:MAG TPA: 50S ribosomal protein L29 [Reyranellaceae bacterium]|nr:50S ribosomal protein L29 [Reyranellaceae bacterium]